MGVAEVESSLYVVSLEAKDNPQFLCRRPGFCQSCKSSFSVELCVVGQGWMSGSVSGLLRGLGMQGY